MAGGTFYPCMSINSNSEPPDVINVDTCSSLHRNASTVNVMQELTNSETYSLALLGVTCLAVLIQSWRSDGEPLYASLALSGVAFAFTFALIRWTGDVFIQRGYKGKDMSKKNAVVM